MSIDECAGLTLSGASYTMVLLSRWAGLGFSLTMKYVKTRTPKGVRGKMCEFFCSAYS